MPSRERIELKRHYSKQSEKDTNAVVEAVADLVVTFLKTCHKACQSSPAKVPPADSHTPGVGRAKEGSSHG